MLTILPDFLLPKDKMIKCKKCKKEYLAKIGDLKPKRIVCPHCKDEWYYYGWLMFG